MDVDRFRDERGYTLVETLVAMTIFVSVVMVMATALGNILLSSDTGRDRMATNIARSQIAALSGSGENAGGEKMVGDFKVEFSSVVNEKLQRITVRVVDTNGATSRKNTGIVLHKVVALK
ncbi:MAG: prepilin-type N-terminal cleavage/methylation domain-containing protein [Ignavibacterium sp.]|jgi:prepilin-type N-terminal cleavage/methylation domain-containing protein